MTASAAGAPVADAAPVHLYYTCTRAPSCVFEAQLAAEDLERLAAMTHPRRRTQFVAGRALLRFALEHNTGRAARSQRLRTAPNGKPECIDGPAISISHSDELAVCAIAPSGQIGVDVQFPVPERRTQTIAEHYFAPAEIAWLGEQHSERFCMLWVLKEAYLKATGLGITGGLRTLECRIAPPIIDAKLANRSARVHLALYSIGGAFVALAALEQPIGDVRVEFWNPDEGRSAVPEPVQLIARTS